MASLNILRVIVRPTKHQPKMQVMASVGKEAAGAATFTSAKDRTAGGAGVCNNGVQHLRRLLDDAGFAALRESLAL